MLATVDSETTGTDSFHGCRPFMFTACDGKYNYLWEGTVNQRTRHVTFSPQKLKDFKDFIYALDTIVFHNTVFDMRMIESCGIDIGPLWAKVEDTLIALHLICNGDVHGLKPCAFKYFGYPMDDEEDLRDSIISLREGLDNEFKAHQGHPCFPALKNQEWWKMDMWMDMPRCRKYAFGDVERTYLLWLMCKKGLVSDGTWNMYLFRKKLLKIVYDMQSHGINMYTEKARRMVNHIRLEKHRLQKAMQDAVGSSMEMDPAKPECLIHMLYNVLNLPIEDRTDTGKPSTAQDTLDKLAKKYPQVTEVHYLQAWRKANKREDAISSYLLWESDSRLHSSVNITGTHWTRQSSSAPNQQNFEKTLLYLFGPPPGKYWLYMDVVNIELRNWAYEVGSKQLIEAFESGQSVHMIIAQVLYPELLARLGEKEFKETATYTNCKSGTFARIYGGGVSKVNRTYGVDRACDIIDTKLPEIGLYFKQLAAKMKELEKKYLYPTIMTAQGYKLEVPILKPYSVPSARIQGGSSLIVQDMMIELVDSYIYKERNCALFQQVHDSLTIEIPIHDEMETTNAQLQFICEAVGKRHMPTCPMDPKVIHCSIDEEPKFHDYMFQPRIGVYESELYYHQGKWVCTADHPTLKYERFKTEDTTKQGAANKMLALLYQKASGVVEYSEDGEEIPF